MPRPLKDSGDNVKKLIDQGKFAEAQAMMGRLSGVTTSPDPKTPTPTQSRVQPQVIDPETTRITSSAQVSSAPTGPGLAPSKGVAPTQTVGPDGQLKTYARAVAWEPKPVKFTTDGVAHETKTFMKKAYTKEFQRHTRDPATKVEYTCIKCNRTYLLYPSQSNGANEGVPYRCNSCNSGRGR